MIIKRFVILFILIFFIKINISYSEWFEINSFNEVPAISKIAKLGKVSIFVVSTNWCTPCQILKEALQRQKYDMTKIDIYIIDMAPKGYSIEELKKSDAYNMWMGIEALESWPTIYITSQISNIKAKFNDKGDDKNIISRINRITKSLLEKNQYFNNDLVNIGNNSNNKDYTVNNDKQQLALENKITKYQDTIKKLYKDINILKNEARKNNSLKPLKIVTSKNEIANLEDSISILNEQLENKVNETEVLINDLNLVKNKIFNLESTNSKLFDSLKNKNNETALIKSELISAKTKISNLNNIISDLKFSMKDKNKEINALKSDLVSSNSSKDETSNLYIDTIQKPNNKLSYYNRSGFSWGVKYPFTKYFQNNTGLEYQLEKWFFIGIDLDLYYFKDKFNNNFGIGFKPFTRIILLSIDELKIFMELGGGLIYFNDYFPKPTDQDPRLGTLWNGVTTVGFGGLFYLSKEISLIFDAHQTYISNWKLKGADRNPTHFSFGFNIGVSFYVFN